MNEPLVNIMFAVSGIFMLAGVIGLFRFRDFYLKVHCATMITVGGVLLSLILFSTQTPNQEIRAKIFALILLMFLTAPVSTHFIALTAYKRGIRTKLRKVVGK